jgi:hypothetical protein
MKIITTRGCKDYYDFMVSVFGEDELIVYDRRNAYPIDSCAVLGDSLILDYFSSKKLFSSDRPKIKINRWNSKKANRHDYKFSKKYRKEGDLYEGTVRHYILEIGYYHYIFEVERYLDDKNLDVLHLEPQLIYTERVTKDKRIGDTPISIIPIYNVYSSDGRINYEINKRHIIANPILASTYIPKYISAEDAWNHLSEYISSLRDVDIIDKRTNDEHIESHGFDKKISFRHRK